MSQNSNDLDDNNNIGLKLKLFNFYYSVLRKKSFGMPVLIIFIIFEAIELISYAFNKIFEKLWKLDKKSFEMIELITGATRITPLMRYLSFNAYLVIFCFISIFIFVNFLLLIMALSFGNGKPKLYNFCILIQSYVTSNVYFFFMVPTMELLLSVNKCENGKIEIITKKDIYCYKGTHFILIIISVIISILQFILIILNSFFNFNPFISNQVTATIDPANNILLVMFKFILVLLYVLLNSEWIQIVIMVLGSFIVFKSTLSNPTYNSDILQCMLVIKSCIVFYTYLILMLGELFSTSSFNGIIYFLPFGYILLSFMSIFLYKYSKKNFVEAKTNFKNEDEFLNRINYFKQLIDDFISQNRARIKNNDYNNYKRKEIVIRGQISLHEENCLDEECPLKKFLENQGNFPVQRTSLLQYANILYVQAIKQFPDSQAILLNFLKFNYEKKYNLSTAKIYLEKIERFKNSIREDYIIFFIKKSQSTIINEDGEEIVINEEDTPQHKFNRFKLLIDTSTKLYGEFWGNLATNLTHNLNLNKLFRVGSRINKYLKEMNKLWEDLKEKKLDHDQQNILQLYSTFVKNILQNQLASTQIENKIKDTNNYQIFKENTEKIDLNNLNKILERPVYQIYTRSNDMGKCHIIQCSNGIVHLLGYNKQELIGKRIEMLMPFICQSEHASMLSDRLKKLRQLMLENHNEDLKDRSKTTFILLPKTKAGYLYPINCAFDIYNDEDFANTFIIRTNFTIKDAKINYCYYICTRPDFSIDSISSSAINLGFTLEILKKYVINMKELLINTKGETIDFRESLKEYTEPKEVYFLGVEKFIGKKAKTMKKDEDEEKKYTETELTKLYKIKMLLNITEIKFRQNEPLGYLFVLNEEKSLIDEKKNDEKINMINRNQLIHYDRNLLLYDVLKFNYVRTNVTEIEEEADEEISGSVEPHQPNGEANNISINNSVKSPTGKRKGETLSSNRSGENKRTKRRKDSYSSSSSNSSSSSSDEAEKKKKNPLTKEAIMALKYKDSETVRTFILSLPFYGNDVNLTRKSPNGSDFRVGFGFEPSIKISVASHISRIDKIYAVDKKNLNKMKQKMFAKRHTFENNLFGENRIEENLEENKEIEELKEGEEKKENEGDKQNSIFDSNLGMNSNTHLKSLFSKRSFFFLQIISLFYFIILICLYIFEFITTYNKFRNLKDYVNYSNTQFDILTSMMYTKYFLTEAVLAQNNSYRIYDMKYNNDHEKYIEEMLKELRDYREKIYKSLNVFSEPEKIGKEFSEYTESKILLIRMLVANDHQNKTIPFWSGINQIPTSIFSISKVENNITEINLNNRNVYDLMMNLINDYFVGWKDTTKLVINSIKDNSKINFLIIFIFSISFVFCILYIIVFYKVLSNFINEGTRPVDLILTIKKSKFEELKIICENYMNTLINKFLGEEVDKVEDDAMGKKLSNSIAFSDNDIVISKFKKRNVYNHSVFSNKKFSQIYICSVISMIIFQIYFIVKFTYSSKSFEDINLCIDVNNVTRNSEVDVILSYNVIKSYFSDPSIPLLNESSEVILKERIKNITDAVEDWTKFTFLYMKNTGKNYMNKFIDLFFKNITNINNGGFDDEAFLGSMKYGFRSLISRYLSLMKTGSLMDLDNINKTDIMDNEELGENGLKIAYVIRPWFRLLNDELKNTLDNIFDKMILLCLALFISYLIGAVVIYALIWKNIEFQLEKYLINSNELINLIPEKIKEDLVVKINEDKDFKNNVE